MTNDIQNLLARLNELVFGTDTRVGFEYVEFDDLREQDINANSMPTDMFNALVSNIRNNGALESVPLCAVRQGSDVREIVSGHHRVRAARQAGKKAGMVMVYNGLTDAEIKAKQLAHNSIAGTSDPSIVAQLFNDIGNLSLQMEAYIDPKQLGKVPDSVPFKQADVNPLAEARVINIVFLPTQFEAFDKTIELLCGAPDTVYVAHKDVFDKFRNAVKATQKEMDIRCVPTAITEMARIVADHWQEAKDNEGHEGAPS